MRYLPINFNSDIMMSFSLHRAHLLKPKLNAFANKINDSKLDNMCKQILSQILASIIYGVYSLHIFH